MIDAPFPLGSLQSPRPNGVSRTMKEKLVAERKTILSYPVISTVPRRRTTHRLTPVGLQLASATPIASIPVLLPIALEGI